MKTSVILFFAASLIFLGQIQVLSCNPVSESLDNVIIESKLTGGKPRVINGTRTSRDDYPFMVSVQYDFRNGFFAHFCGASIFDQNHVITAAHCLENYAPENVTLRFGEWKRDEYEAGEALRRSVAFFMHPQYNNRTFENDIALITFNEALEFTNSIQPICLTSQPVVPGEEAYVMGWGDTRGTEDNNYLQEAMVPVIGGDNCSSEYDWLDHLVVDGMLCAGYERGQIDSCQGDSGGPLVRKTENSRGGFELIGIVSWGFGCAKLHLPGVYTDVFYYLDWIRQIAGEPNFGSFNQFECPDPTPNTTSSSPVTTPETTSSSPKTTSEATSSSPDTTPETTSSSPDTTLEATSSSKLTTPDKGNKDTGEKLRMDFPIVTASSVINFLNAF